MKYKKNLFLVVGTFAGMLFLAFYFFIPTFSSVAYRQNTRMATSTDHGITQSITPIVKSKEPELVVTHIKTPDSVKGIYMTACVVSMPSFREKLVHIVDRTEINSIVIDVKDFSGTITFRPEHQLLKDNAGRGCRTNDLREFIAELHKKGIYVIARITVFQDPYYTKLHPELSVHKKSTGSVWKDRKGLSFVDVSAKPFWEYIVALGKESYAIGFDELNFDYIRFPSDGDMKDIEFTLSKGMSKPEALEHFFAYLHNEFKDTGVKISADLFGMTTTNTDDLNIGQVLERAMPYFDYVMPMVYPSHYPPNFNGWKNPNNHSYDLIKL